MTGNDKKNTTPKDNITPEETTTPEENTKPEEITTPEETGRFDPVALAEKNFNRVLNALDGLADELHGREDQVVAKASKLATEARGAIQTIFNERQRIAKLDDDKPRAGGAELDLDAARLEIGRRLALLRERGGAEDLSGGAE